MRRLESFAGVILLGLATNAGRAGAGEFTFSFHDASGSGCANVFDGGPELCDSGGTIGPNDSNMSFLATDRTQLGSLGALARAHGESRIYDLQDFDGITVQVELFTGYIPSFFPGGDNPGGAAEGELSSIIEFIMPADELIWGYYFDVDDTIDFEGSTSILFENVTESETILTFSDDDAGALFEGILSANTGDLMRITSMMSGSGSTGPASVREYEARLSMTFIVPEPTTMLWFAIGGAIIYLGSDR